MNQLNLFTISKSPAEDQEMTDHCSLHQSDQNQPIYGPKPGAEDQGAGSGPQKIGQSGACEHCPACDQRKMMCHHTAYYEHRPGHGVPCTQIREACPRMEVPE
jgi:hypothetical protein